MKYLCLLITLFPIAVQARTKVLVSYFKPFGGSSENNTALVAAQLKSIKELKKKGIEVVLCPIHQGQGVDVSFYSPRSDIAGNPPGKEKLEGSTSAFQQVKECLDRNPEVSAVYNMGEGSCKVTYENFAYNGMETGSLSDLKDHNGNLIYQLNKIDKNAPAYIELDKEKNLQAFCYAKLKNPSFAKDAVMGHDPGNYVCNNLAFNMQRYIQHSHPKMSYEFIHVPVSLDRNSYCGDAEIMMQSGTVQEKNQKFALKIAQNISEFIISKKTLNEQKRLNEELCRDDLPGPEITRFIEQSMRMITPSKDLLNCMEEERKVLKYKRNTSVMMRDTAL